MKDIRQMDHESVIRLCALYEGVLSGLQFTIDIASKSNIMTSDEYKTFLVNTSKQIDEILNQRKYE